MRLLSILMGLLVLVGCENAVETAKRADPQQEKPVELKSQRNEVLSPVIVHDDLDGIRKKGVLRVLVTHSRTDFFVDQGQMRGIQVEFVNAFEKQLNQGISNVSKKLRVEFYPVAFDQLIPSLVAGKGDLIANFLTITPEREAQVDFVSGRKASVNEVLVGNHSITGIGSLDDLSDRQVHVLRGSSYVSHLNALNADLVKRHLKPMTVVEVDSQLLSEDILELVNAGIYSLTVMDDFRAVAWQKVMSNLRFYPDLSIKSGNTIGWAIAKNTPQLKAQLDRFIAGNKKGTLVGNLLFSRYFKQSRWIADPTNQDNETKLEKYRAYFKIYAKQYGHDERLLAAVAFQESGLNHSSKSHRGAVGLMQLLPTTAADKMVGIADISAPEDNIHAGAKYLAFIRDRYFSDDAIKDKDRQAFMLAAYNAGPAKVRKMRQLATSMGLNSNQWFGHVAIAAAQLVGRETPTYVANIQKYHLAYRLTDQLVMKKSKVIESH